MDLPSSSMSIGMERMISSSCSYDLGGGVIGFGVLIATGAGGIGLGVGVGGAGGTGAGGWFGGTGLLMLTVLCSGNLS